MDGARPLPKPKRKPLMSRIPPGFVQAVLKGHSGLGIAFAAAIYIVCLSGTLAVFYDEFIRWENPAAPHVTQVSSEAVQSALEGAIARGADEVEHVYATLPAGDIPLFRVYVDAQEDSEWAADSDGRIAAPLNKGWSSFVTSLHIYLHLPGSWGIFVVGMTGVALLSSLISGLLAHPRIFRDAFHLRLGGSERLQEADLHNRIGVWGLPFHIVVSLSGAFLGLVTITVGVLGMAMFDGDTNKIYGLFLPQEPVDNPAPAEMLDVRPFFDRLPTDNRLERVVLEHPLEQGGAALFEVRDDSVLAGGESYAFNRNGELYYSKNIQQSPLGERVLGSLGPLHFGWFAGGIVKIAYDILGLGMTYLAVGGIKIWLARRRDKGRPAPAWERVWESVIWGQPLALCSVALLAILMPGLGYEALIPVWGGISVAALCAAAVLSAAHIREWGKLLSGILLIVIALWHMATIAPPSGDALIWSIDAVILLGGAVLLAVGLRGRLGNVSQPAGA